MINSLAKCLLRFNQISSPLFMRIHYDVFQQVKQKGFSTRRVLEAHVKSSKYESYFKKIGNELTQEMNEIINDLNPNKNKNINQQIKLINSYLQVQGVHVSSKTLNDLMALLVAINMHNKEALLVFRNNIFEYILRNDLYDLQMNFLQMHCFIDCYNHYQSTFITKRKTQHVVYSFMTVIMRNISKVHFNYYLTILFLTLDLENFNVVSYLKLSHTLQLQILKSIQLTMDNPEKLVHQNKMFKSTHFVITMMKNIFKYECAPGHYGNFHNFLEKCIFDQKFKEFKDTNLIFLMKIYRLIPVRQKNYKGQSYKNIFFDRLIPYVRKANFNDQNLKKYWHHFLSTILHHFFYEKWADLNFTEADGLIYLQKEDLKSSPELPELFWEIYNANPEQINLFETTRSAIQVFYPERYRETPSSQLIPTIEPKMQTEMRIRMQMVMLRLGLNYEKEKKITSRYIDFVIDNKILMQIDGIHHYSPYYYENDDVTIFRNLHLLHAGYKLVIVNIFEYNKNRETPELAAYVQRKLNKINETNCIAVL